jgi:hypothetical protein
VVDANTTSVTAPIALNDGETYTAVLTAFDNSVGGAWTTDSDTLTFRVDSQADASFSPASKVLRGSENATNFTIALDRAANPSTVSASTVLLTRGDGTEVGHTVGCNTPCTTIVVDPSSNLAAGQQYTLRLSGVKSADEGLTFAGSASYTVPYVDGGGIGAPLVCGSTSSTSSGFTLGSGPNPAVFLEFDISGAAGGWKLEALFGSTVIATMNGSGNGHARFDFTTASGGTLTFRLTATTCPSSPSASNLFGARVP